MELLLERYRFSGKSTIGRLYVDGELQCYTLEDTVREQTGMPVEQWKVPGETAIPKGRYNIVRTMSPKYGRMMPLLRDVPGFAGIRIHSGNFPKDTEGCILVGHTVSVDMVGDSRIAFHSLDEKLEAALARGESVWIDVT